VEALEDRLAERTAPLSWSPPVFASARRPASEQALGGSLRREELLHVPAPIRRRALFRLLVEGTGHPPSSQVLGQIVTDLAEGRATRRSLAGGWSLQLRSDLLHLEPPARADSGRERPVERARAPQLAFPFEEVEGIPHEPRAQVLDLPGLVALPDGRQITAEIVYLPPGRTCSDRGTRSRSRPTTSCRSRLGADRRCGSDSRSPETDSALSAPRARRR
jgi:hypothetical protein